MKGRRVVFRADASLEIGTGHVMRCLTLADMLRGQGAICEFICRTHDGHMIDPIRQRGYPVHELPVSQAGQEMEKGCEGQPAHAGWLGATWRDDAEQTLDIMKREPADWLVVDHYALDDRWERHLRPFCKKLMVIDDLADRLHGCDLLLDHNPGRHGADYDPWLSGHCMRLTGPAFALLRPDFAQYRAGMHGKSARETLRRVLVSLGGVDKDNVTGAVLQAIQACELPADTRIIVILGSRSPWLDQVRRQVDAMRYPAELLVDVREMAVLLSGIDLAVGAAGVSALERCCMGVPTLLIAIAENQRPGAIALDAAGAAILLDAANVADGIARQLPPLMSGDRLGAISETAASLCDGDGSARVVAAMEYLLNERLAVRKAEEADAATLFRWANDPITRSNAINTAPIDWNGHVSWLHRKLSKRDDCVMIIAGLSRDMPCGQVRFDRDAAGDWIISYVLAPEFRQLGLGRPLLTAALDVLGSSFPDAVAIGHVKPENRPSRRVFEALGFHVSEPVDGLISYRRTVLDAQMAETRMSS